MHTHQKICLIVRPRGNCLFIFQSIPKQFFTKDRAKSNLFTISVLNILWNILHIFPYKTQVVIQLKDHDDTAHTEFTNLCLQDTQADKLILNRVMYSKKLFTCERKSRQAYFNDFWDWKTLNIEEKELGIVQKIVVFNVCDSCTWPVQLCQFFSSRCEL